MVELYSDIAQKYALKIQKIVSELYRYRRKDEPQYDGHLVDDETARRCYGAQVGEKYYLFPNEAPSQDIIDEYERVKPYFGEGEDRVTFEEHLSHRGATVFFHGKDYFQAPYTCGQKSDRDKSAQYNRFRKERISYE